MERLALAGSVGAVGLLIALFGAWLVLATWGTTTTLGGSPFVFNIPFGGLEYPLVIIGAALALGAVLYFRSAR